MLGDLHYAIRILFKSPGFVLVAVFSLALGIGGNAAIFTLVKAVFLQPLPVHDSARLVSVFQTDVKNPGQFGFSYRNYQDYRDRNTVFSGLLADQPLVINLSSGSGDPEQIIGEMVSGNYFSVLGVEPVLGRAFLPEEDQVPDRNAVVVLSHRLWERRFGSNRALIGQNIILNAHAFTVIGVAPEGFQGTFLFSTTELWVPVMAHHFANPGDSFFELRRSLIFTVVGRLKPGVKLPAAASEMAAIAHQLALEFPADNQGRSAKLLALPEAYFPPQARSLLTRVATVLITTVALILLIACANIANLLLVRAASRRKEVAIRASLGAARWRMVRQLLAESLVLALMGGVVGLFFSVWGRNILWSFRPPFLSQTNFDIHLDWMVIVFTMLVSILTGILFGLAPALQMSRPDLATELKERTNQNARGSRFRLRDALVVGQVALSLIALAGAGMFVSSLHNAEKLDPGYDAAHLMMLTVSPTRGGYSAVHAQDFYDQVLNRIRSLPGVRAASFAQNPPYDAGPSRSVFIEGGDATPGNAGILTFTEPVSPGYFETVGVPILRGRDFQESDRNGSPLVAIVNEAMAARFWPDQDAVGKRFKFYGQEYREVIGVAKNSKYGDVSDRAVPAFVYSSLAQTPVSSVTLHVRAAGDPSALLGLVRNEVQSLDHKLPLLQVRTASEMLSLNLWFPRLGAGMLAVFGFLALLLATVGLYGVMAYSVSQRSGEIGIRMALGARQSDVTGMLLREVMLLVTPGVLVGALVAIGLARSITSLLFGVSPYDATTLIGAAALLFAVALLATISPARRAMRVDPLIALRQE